MGNTSVIRIRIEISIIALFTFTQKLEIILNPKKILIFIFTNIKFYIYKFFIQDTEVLMC